ncbi:MAG: Vitamin B12 ABC transporter, substrate-binding protein BtuF [uncultured Cytophagales bacterium]|uniref:Vitamin B12 ABC transporter, substrate-binding protein BtuF n=1 Tax=uncultured Cytophagales bacterium TaxID=158755 RepID=A0A6J4KE96_9SPHI|nr:MAG: Vitamin B12 ABC transporter, substrate-binding protein BtuF [uncultured Cytophagales bacterium]
MALFLGILLAAAGCGGNPASHEAVRADTLRDALGRQVRLAGTPRRVMALAPSLTEMLFLVCDSGQIAAVTQNCDYPAAAKRKPVVNSYPVDFEGLLRVKPDLVFAVEGITPLADARRIEDLGIPVYYQQYRTVEDVLRGIETVGTLTGHAEKAGRLADSLRTRRDAIRRETANLPKPKVLAIIWPQDPIYVFGRNTVFSDKLAAAGGVNAVDTVFEAESPALTREYILKINPDVIISDGFAKMDTTFFRQYPELRRVNAYRNRRVYRLSDDLMSRPGPRVVESILEIRNAIHPQPTP